MKPPSPIADWKPAARLVTLASSLVLGACAVAPRNVGTAGLVEPPGRWSAAAVASATPTSLAAWWQSFGDPDLTALVLQALQANTDLRSAQAALQQARAQRDLQAAGLAPTLAGSASAQRSRSGGHTANRFQVGFDAGWEPDVFGGLAAGVAASEADAGASAASLASVQVSVAAEVATTYMALRGAQQRLAIARENLAAQLETLQIAQWRRQAGLATSLDVEQARAAAEQTRSQVPTLEATVAQALNALAVLTGQVPGALQASLATGGAIPQADGSLALAFPAETLRQRPDVRAAELKVAAAAARTDAADAARRPTFQLGGSLGLSALALNTLTNGASVVGALLGSVSFPLLDGGAARARVRIQEAGLDAERIHYQAVVLVALQEVEDALVALQKRRERLATLGAAADAAANAAQLAAQRYRSGLVDFQVVLETQRTLLSAQDGVAATTTDLGTDHVRLYKALGGGWATEPPTAKTSGT